MDIHLRHKLIHAVTEYDRRQEARNLKAGRRHNIYALSHYFGALGRIAEDATKGDLRAAVLANMTGPLAAAVLRAAGLPKMTEQERRG